VITRESMEKFSEMIDGFTEERYEQSVASVFDAQPDVLEFLVSCTEGWVQAEAISLSFCVFKAYEAEYPGKAVRVEREDLEAVFHQAKAWMAQLESPYEEDPPAEAEPFLLNYIVEHLTTLHQKGVALSRAEHNDILLLVKTVILALDRAARRRSG
jgi:hypothetical protein